MSGWWFGDDPKSCGPSNLNGPYLKYGHTIRVNGVPTGIRWDSWQGDKYSMKSVEMKVRPVTFGT